VLAIDETQSEDEEDEGEARWCEQTGSESSDIHSAFDGEDEAAPQAERFRETQDDRSNSGNASFG
jgi:hypothetical protein